MQFLADLSLNRGDFTLDAKLGLTLSGITAVFGPSGSGKTTLLRCIAGLERARGLLALGSETWQSPKFFMLPHRRRVGFIFQETDLFPHLDVEKNLLYGYRRLAATDRRFHPSEIMELLAIQPLLSRHVAGLSGGERQRVALGRAVLGSAKILLMDEPLAALDQAAKLPLFPFLRRTASELKIPIIYVSHSLDEVARLADSLILMDRGTISATGEIGTMLTRLDLPLARSAEAESLIVGAVSEHEPDFQLTRVRFSGGVFIIPRIDAAVDAPLRLRIVASDVSLSLTRHTDSSILNVFAARVLEIAEESPALLLVKLDLSGTAILARITRKSYHTLGISIGSAVFAQIKSAAALV